MTRDDISRMAVECSLLTTVNREGAYAEAIERFAKLVAAHVAAVPAQDVQPVAWMASEVTNGDTLHWTKRNAMRFDSKPVPLYTHPPAADVAELVEALQDLCDTLGECGMTGLNKQTTNCYDGNQRGNKLTWLRKYRTVSQVTLLYVVTQNAKHP